MDKPVDFMYCEIIWTHRDKTAWYYYMWIKSVEFLYVESERGISRVCCGHKWELIGSWCSVSFCQGTHFNNILLRTDAIHGNDVMYISNFLVENMLRVLSTNIIRLLRGKIF
jgi:hypothetical protein